MFYILSREKVEGLTLGFYDTKGEAEREGIAQARDGLVLKPESFQHKDEQGRFVQVPLKWLVMERDMFTGAWINKADYVSAAVRVGQQTLSDFAVVSVM